MHVVCLTAEGTVCLLGILLTEFRPEQNKDRTMTEHRLCHKGEWLINPLCVRTSCTETRLMTVISS